MLKTHGFLKAANSIADSLSSGITAGMVIIIFEDKTGAHSDNILNFRDMIQGMGIPYKYSDEKNIYTEIIELYTLALDG